MAKFKMDETLAEDADISARFGAATAEVWDQKEVGKAVKLAADSRYNYCTAGDGIEGFVSSVDPDLLDNFAFGAVRQMGRKRVTADGLQATPGTGTIAVGDYVVAGTMVARGTAVASGEYQRVCKATFQPTSEASALTDVNDMLKVTLWPWRVVAIQSGTGVPGDTIVIERMQ